MDLHAELVEIALPYISSFHDDLLKHDKSQLEMYPERPFLHFTGDTGTHMITLLFLRDYPKGYERVPYLFGTADKEHILKEFTSTVNCLERCNRTDLILYFDGIKLKVITYERAKSIVAEYTRKMKVSLRYH
jgi:hypothetical protein